MRTYPLFLSASVVWALPLAADPLRDMAAEYFGPLPAVITELDGKTVTPEKVALGQALFFDARLSATGEQSCASCHDLAAGGEDGRATALLADGTDGLRNTATVLNAVLNGDHFWDGRPEDLAAQEAGPHVAGIAMLNSPEAAVAAVAAIPDYAPRFAAAFPEQAGAISLDTMAEALWAYQATLLTPAPFDAWLAGDEAALSADAKAGLQLFLDQGCAFCHFGPNLGGQGYFPLGLVEMPGVDLQAADEAAMFAMAEGANIEFVFRTAPLRNIALTAPYFHSGKVQDLAAAVDIMATGQLGTPLQPEDRAQVVAFLESLTGTLPAGALPAP